MQGPTGRLAAGLRGKASPPFEIVRLVDGEVNLDGVNRRNGGDRTTAGRDQCAHLKLGLSRYLPNFHE